MVLYLKFCYLGKIQRYFFIDSARLAVCNSKRVHNHHVFKDIAERRKTTIGWFYGFKVHLIVNDKGEILNFIITQGIIDDRKPLYQPCYVKKNMGKLYVDMGYNVL
jgi:hypothetical protein